MHFGVHFRIFFWFRAWSSLSCLHHRAEKFHCFLSIWNSFRTVTGEDRFTDPWLVQYNKSTEGYVTADGNTIRFPFWLRSEEFMLYGGCRRAVGGSGSWRTPRTSPRRWQCCDLRLVQQLGGFEQRWSLPRDVVLHVCDSQGARSCRFPWTHPCHCSPLTLKR